jgi:hypothetical protein
MLHKFAQYKSQDESVHNNSDTAVQCSVYPCIVYIVYLLYSSVYIWYLYSTSGCATQSIIYNAYSILSTTVLVAVVVSGNVVMW